MARGDLSIIGKAPLVRRLSYARGFGLAASLRVNAPTGEQQAFASDGDWTFSPTLIGDYRLAVGRSSRCKQAATIGRSASFRTSCRARPSGGGWRRDPPCASLGPDDAGRRLRQRQHLPPTGQSCRCAGRGHAGPALV